MLQSKATLHSHTIGNMNPIKPNSGSLLLSAVFLCHFLLVLMWTSSGIITLLPDTPEQSNPSQPWHTMNRIKTNYGPLLLSTFSVCHSVPVTM